jgi:hypothetical protein
VLKESPSSDYEEFLKDLPDAECRWAVYDLEFQNEEGNLRKKIIFFQWYVGSYPLPVSPFDSLFVASILF